ncbi:DUF2490 domain-containing protein [Sphingomonas psychrotolerans]|uniref:DUF2490 domain-containing protein n=1 Tax=Sphingomonas psychrotolerans TaxID=1327635 RepID=A0ABU3NB09_9SPHN|nr:DUF2490 domain-containing protein [Sphingomonas psychrotolerans]MDT8761094.1 DUF2490 domain-containing protein [Sphingomonas psychrotolerans]
MPRFAFLSAVLLLAPAAAHAQQTDTQLWLQTNATVVIGHREKVTLEGIGRFSDRAEGFSHAEAGALFTHKTASGIELSIGYRHVEDWNRGVALPNEERLRQMVLVPFGGGFSGRLRLEERFNSSGGEVGVRVRPRLGFDTPLNDKGLRLFATQEHFVNFNTTGWGQQSGYERMRNAVGLSLGLGGNLRGEIGYLNQYRFGRDGRRDQMDHAATFTLSFNVASIGDSD